MNKKKIKCFPTHVITQGRTATPLEEHVIRSLQSYELMLLSDMQVHIQSFYDLVNIIREHSDIFLAWHSSETAKLYSPAVFRNKKQSSGYWF